MRFGIKSLLMAIAVVAVWIASYRMGPGTGDFIRKCMLLAVFVVAGSVAIDFRNKWRAFWAGFFATMLILGQRNILPVYTPDVSNLMDIYETVLLGERRELRFSLYILIILALSTVIGLISAAVCDRNQGSDATYRN